MKNNRPHVALLITLILAYLGFLFYFLTIQPGGANGNPIAVKALIGFVAGSMMIMAIFSLTFYLYRSGEKALLYFSLFCFSGGVRFLTEENNMILTDIFPGLSYEVAWSVFTVAIGLSVTGIIGFNFEIFANNKHKKRMRFFMAAVSAAVAIDLILYAILGYSPDVAIITRILIMLTVQFSLIYIIIMIAKSKGFKENKLNKLYFCCAIVFTIASVFTGLFAEQVPNVGAVSYSMFVIAHIILLSERYSRTINEKELLEKHNQMKTELLANISHETRTPLAIVSSYTQLIAEELRAQGVNEQQAKDLDTVSDELQHIGHLMKDMQELTRSNYEGTEKSIVSTLDLINQTTKLYKHILERQNTVLTVELPETMPNVFVNPGELSRVLYNLMQNTRNHTQGGEVTVKALIANNKKYIEISVADTGAGITSDLLPRIFERGVKGDGGGSGIGLAMCKEIIESNGGEISIESELGKGTVARFTLPIYEGSKNAGK
jgi:signal transduction histidine kinase